MQSVLGKRQMNLVIVDEVDGIAGAIAHLLSLLYLYMFHYILSLQGITTLLSSTCAMGALAKRDCTRYT